jgi:hypothetical protein
MYNFDRKTEEKRPLERDIRRREANIKTTLKEIGSEIVDWIHLAQGGGQLGALVNTIMNVRDLD